MPPVQLNGLNSPQLRNVGSPAVKDTTPQSSSLKASVDVQRPPSQGGDAPVAPQGNAKLPERSSTGETFHFHTDAQPDGAGHSIRSFGSSVTSSKPVTVAEIQGDQTAQPLLFAGGKADALSGEPANVAPAWVRNGLPDLDPVGTLRNAIQHPSADSYLPDGVGHSLRLVSSSSQPVTVAEIQDKPASAFSFPKGETNAPSDEAFVVPKQISEGLLKLTPVASARADFLATLKKE